MVGVLFFAGLIVVGIRAALSNGTIHGGKSSLATASGCSKCDSKAPCSTCSAE